MITPTPNPNYYFTSSTQTSVSGPSGNQIYICEIGSQGQLSSESWTTATNTLYTSIGLQSGNTCSATLSSGQASIIGAYDVNVPTTSNTVYAASYQSTSNNPELEYTVTNSINTVVIAISGGGSCSGWSTPIVPSGGTEELFKQDSERDMIYYYTYQNQAPGNYGVTSLNAGCAPPASVAVYVFENNVITPTPDPNYYFTSSTQTSVSASSGNQIYICEIGSHGQLSSESWTTATNTLYTSTGLQSGNTCSATLPSGQASIIGAYGVNVPTTSNTVYAASYQSNSNNPQLEYTVTNSINTVVIAISGSNACSNWSNPSVPSGGDLLLFQQDVEEDLNYYDIYQNQAPGMYTISGLSAGCAPPMSFAAIVFQNT